MVRANQGGSVLSFIVVGVILTAVLLGGVYFVRQQTAVPVSTPSQGTQPPAADPKPSDVPKEEPTKPQPQSSSQPTTAPTPATLPQTGPAESFIALVAVAALSVTSISYVRSRRPHLSL